MGVRVYILVLASPGCYYILKQENNSLREENKSQQTAIRLINNEFQNPNEEKCS